MMLINSVITHLAKLLKFMQNDAFQYGMCKLYVSRTVSETFNII